MLRGEFAKIYWIFVPTNTLQITYYNALVQPFFDYCSPLRDNCGNLSKDKMQKFLSRVARVITGFTFEIRSPNVLESAPSWKKLDVHGTILYKVCLYV